jgi:8-hydroxy-5-deazaflavin:NADPH oxidoreductase
MVAGGDPLGHGVWNHVGRSLPILPQRSPERAVLFYATDDDRASEDVERLIRAAGLVPVKVGEIDQSSRLEVGGDLHDLVVGPAEARSLIRRA